MSQQFLALFPWKEWSLTRGAPCCWFILGIDCSRWDGDGNMGGRSGGKARSQGHVVGKISAVCQQQGPGLPRGLCGEL